MLEHLRLRFADTELTLHHDQVEALRQLHLFDLGTLARRLAVGDEGERDPPAAQLRERLQSARERLQSPDAGLYYERPHPARDALVPPSELLQRAAGDADARPGLVEAPPVLPLRLLPVPAVGGQKRLQHPLPVQPMLPRHLRGSLLPGDPRRAVGVDDRVVHVEQDAGGERGAGGLISHAATVRHHGRVFNAIRSAATETVRVHDMRQRRSSTLLGDLRDLGGPRAVDFGAWLG